MHQAGSQTALIQQALAAVGGGDTVRALRLVDRACRTGLPEAEHLLLKSALLNRLGRTKAAADALEDAFRLAPLNAGIAVRVLTVRARTHASANINAMAADIARYADDLAYAEQLAPFLTRDGQRALGRIHRVGSECRIDLLCSSAETMSLTVCFDGTEQHAVAVPSHRLHRSDWFPFAAQLAVPWPEGAGACRVSTDAAVLWLRDTAAGDLRRVNATGPWTQKLRPVHGPATVTIILPVYRDAPATARCLRSVLADRSTATPWRLLIVNDASDDPDIAIVLASLAGDHRIDVIHHRESLGFTGAVNAALRQVPTGPVILLNSDTVVPPGWIDRLTAAARSHSDIGTATPLSNNGEFTSFPKLGGATALLGDANIFHRDALAQRVNTSRVVDIPSGVGFCLYISDACRRAVGLLDPSFGRGYLEDADFCLRAAALGFRNVCATDVYVGHAGSVSFGDEKRFLVARHRLELARRHPRHTPECARFMAIDPLRDARDSLQRALVAADDRPTRLIVSRARAPDDPIVEECLRLLGPSDDRSVLVLCGGLHEGRLLLHALDGDCPNQLSIGQAAPLDQTALLRVFPGAPIGSVVLLDQSRVLDDLLLSLDETGPPVDLVIADAFVLCQCLHAAPQFTKFAPALAADETCQRCPCAAPDLTEEQARRYRTMRRQAIARARSIIVPHAAQQRVAGDRAVSSARVPPLRLRPEPALSGSRRRSLAIRHVARRVRDFERLRLALLHLRTSHADWDCVIIGETLDDHALMRSGAVHVTGPVAAVDTLDVAMDLDCDALFLDLPDAAFADPHWHVVSTSPLPVGTYDSPATRAVAAQHPLHLVAPDGPAAPLTQAIASFIDACTCELT